MIGTTAAILGAAAIGAVGTGITSSNAANAAKKAGQQQAESDAAALALQEKIFNQNRADNEWQRQLGMSAGSALSGAFGLSGGGTSTGGAGGVTMTGPRPDYNAYLAANPDVATEANRVISSDPKAIGDLNGDGKTDNLDYAQYHATTFHDRPVPTAEAAPVDPNAPQPGYNDPTAVGGYTSPVRMTQAPLDVSAGAYRASPGFQWQMEQGLAAQDHIASAGGGVMSGQRTKAALRYSQGLADQDFTDWRNYTTGQFNADRNFNEATFEGDRSRLDSRYDTRNNQLLTMTGFGSAATAANQNAASSFANASTNLMTDQGRARADATTGAASAWNQGIGNVMTAGAYLGGRYMTGTTVPKVPTTGSGYVAGYDPAWGGG